MKVTLAGLGDGASIFNGVYNLGQMEQDSEEQDPCNWICFVRLDANRYIWVTCNVGPSGVSGHIEGAVDGSEFVNDYFRRATSPIDCSALSGDVPLFSGTDAESTFTIGEP